MRNDALFGYKKIKPLQLEYLLNIYNNKSNGRKTQIQTNNVCLFYENKFLAPEFSELLIYESL